MLEYIFNLPRDLAVSLLGPTPVPVPVPTPVVPLPDLCDASDYLCKLGELAAEHPIITFAVGGVGAAGAAYAGAKKLGKKDKGAQTLESVMSTEQFALIKGDQKAMIFMSRLLLEDPQAFEYARRLPIAPVNGETTSRFEQFVKCNEKFQNALINADGKKTSHDVKIVAIKRYFGKGLDLDNADAPKSLARTREEQAAQEAAAKAKLKNDAAKKPVAQPGMAASAFTAMYNRLPKNPFHKAPAVPVADATKTAKPAS